MKPPLLLKRLFDENWLQWAGPVEIIVDPAQTNLSEAFAGAQERSGIRVLSIAAEGLLLFPVAEMYFFRCGNFLGCKAGLSLLLVFFPASAAFFLASDGFFPASDWFFFSLPPKCIFSAAKVLF